MLKQSCIRPGFPGAAEPHRGLLLCAVCLGLLCPAWRLVVAQAPAKAAPEKPAAAIGALTQPRSPRAWANRAAQEEIAMLGASASMPVRYREQHRDARGTATREVIETRAGNVARTLELNGAPLDPAAAAAERDRLNDILRDPAPFLKRQRRALAGQTYIVELLRELPRAMLWSDAPAQPLPGLPGMQQAVLDFVPDPQYRPPSLVCEALSGLAGRVWIDRASGRVLRIEGQILHPVELGWGGMLARIGQGGTVSLEQRPVNGSGRWLYTGLSEDLTLRELMVHTSVERSQIMVSEASLLAQPVSLQEGLQWLLALPVPVR